MKHSFSDLIRTAVCILPLSAAAGCSTSGAAGLSKQTNIRYANMPVILETILSSDEEWIAVSSRKKNAGIRIEELKKARAASSAGEEEMSLVRETAELDIKENRIRKRVYPDIYAAVKSAARRGKYDFILNMDDTLLYAGSSFDVTGEILQELKTIRARSDPLLR